MVAAMADLMQQNQEITREFNRRRRQRHDEKHEQNSKNERAENDVEGGDQSRGTITCMVPYLEKEIDQMKRAM